MTQAVHCGIVPEHEGRERSLLPRQLNPEAPDSLMAGCGIADMRGISSASPDIPARVPW